MLRELKSTLFFPRSLNNCGTSVT